MSNDRLLNRHITEKIVHYYLSTKALPVAETYKVFGNTTLTVAQMANCVFKSSTEEVYILFYFESTLFIYITLASNLKPVQRWSIFHNRRNPFFDWRICNCEFLSDWNLKDFSCCSCNGRLMELNWIPVWEQSWRTELTFTFPYFHVNTTTMGKQQMTMQERTRMVVRITQSRDTTQGRSFSQDSHPSGHGKHSNIPDLPYWFSSPCKEKNYVCLPCIGPKHIHQHVHSIVTNSKIKINTWGEADLFPCSILLYISELEVAEMKQMYKKVKTSTSKISQFLAWKEAIYDLMVTTF